MKLWHKKCTLTGACMKWSIFLWSVIMLQLSSPPSKIGMNLQISKQSWPRSNCSFLVASNKICESNMSFCRIIPSYHFQKHKQPPNFIKFWLWYHWVPTSFELTRFTSVVLRQKFLFIYECVWILRKKKITKWMPKSDECPTTGRKIKT